MTDRETEAEAGDSHMTQITMSLMWELASSICQQAVEHGFENTNVEFLLEYTVATAKNLLKIQLSKLMLAFDDKS